MALTVLIRGPNGKISIAVRKYRSLFKNTRKILIALLYKYENFFQKFFKLLQMEEIWGFMSFCFVFSVCKIKGNYVVHLAYFFLFIWQIWL